MDGPEQKVLTGADTCRNVCQLHVEKKSMKIFLHIYLRLSAKSESNTNFTCGK